MPKNALTERPRLLSFPKDLPEKPQFGERLRLRIVEGENLGTGYCLFADSIVIGRDYDCDLMIEDDNASRRHVELVWKKNRYFAQDMDSANGLLINTKRVKGAFVDPGDVIAVGNTIFEVISSGKASQIAFSDQVMKAGAKPLTEEEKKLKKNKTTVLFVLFVLFMLALGSSEQILTFRDRAYISFTDEEIARKRVSKSQRKQLLKERKAALKRSIPSFNTGSPGYKKAQEFYHKGMRELNAKNYRRSIAAFETSITVDPSHEQSKIYLEIAKKRLMQEVLSTFQSAVRARKAFRYREAKMHYKNVIQLLVHEPKHTMYTNSEEALVLIQKQEEKPF